MTEAKEFIEELEKVNPLIKQLPKLVESLAPMLNTLPPLSDPRRGVALFGLYEKVGELGQHRHGAEEVDRLTVAFAEAVEVMAQAYEVLRYSDAPDLQGLAARLEEVLFEHTEDL